MWTLSETEFNERLNKIKEENTSKEYRKILREEKSKYRPKFNIETSKLIAIYLFLLLNIVLVYAMVAMWKFADLSYLGVLITDIVAQILAYIIYCLKAYHGKKQEENLRFEREKLRGSISDIITSGAEKYEKENGVSYK